MSTEIKVPALGESITEAVVLEWLVQPGDAIAVDQEIIVLETDKITVNVPSPISGVLLEQKVEIDDELEIGAVFAIVDESATAVAKPAAVAAVAAVAETKVAAKPEIAVAAPKVETVKPAAAHSGAPLMPAVRRMINENGLDPAKIIGSGRGGRILKEDVQRYMRGEQKAPASATLAAPAPAKAASVNSNSDDASREEIVKMSKLRRTIAKRLVGVQQNAAILTTFNEIDMSAVKALRTEHKAAFEKKFGVRLGFMSFFTKAAIEGLKAFPAVNGEMRGDSIVYKNYYHVGIAVGGGRGLVVPVVRDADQLSFAEFESSLGTLAGKAQKGTLALSDLTGGTFTISNGGVYGSMMSTPILNPPQSGILGLHKIENRPVAIDGQVVIRPMMYVALSYDHRIVDGREAVGFLVRLKECMENPSRILLEI